jgi:hypothetical protein
LPGPAVLMRLLCPSAGQPTDGVKAKNLGGSGRSRAWRMACWPGAAAERMHLVVGCDEGD